MGWADDYAKVIHGLSAQQRAIVEDIAAGYLSGTRLPLRVIACAGSGKTATMVAAVAYLVNKKVDGKTNTIASPRDLVVTTFTKKAAAEIKQRIERVTHGGVVGSGGARVVTYHGLAYSAVSRAAKSMPALRRPHQWVIGCNLDIGNRANALNEALKEGFQMPEEKVKTLRYLDTGDLWDRIALRGEIPGLSPAIKSVKDTIHEDVEPKELATAVEIVRSYGVDTPAAAVEAKLLQTDSATYLGWVLYNRVKNSLNAWDFADVLQAYWELIQAGGDRARLVIVDEAQDNTKIQMDVAAGLARNHPQGRASYVGDTRQSIYAFRGAQPEILGQLDSTQGATTLELSTNYRSAIRIVDAGNAVAEGEDWAVGAPAVAHRPDAGKIDYFEDTTGMSRARRIALDVKAALEQGVQPNTFAVLARTRAAMAPFEVMFLAHGVPALVQGGSPFFKVKCIQRVMAYLQMAVGVAPVEVLLKDLGASFRDLGAQYVSNASMATVWDEAGLPPANNGTPLPILHRLTYWMDQELDKSRRTLLWGRDGAQEQREEAFAQLLAILEGAVRATSGREAVESVALALAQRRIITLPETKEGADNDPGEGDTDREMIGSLAEIADGLGLAGLIEISMKAGQLASVIGEGGGSSQRRGAAAEVDQNKVVVGTVHSSKGLEWPTVYLLAGATELPHMGKDDPEERRLFYVGVTRARDRLVLANGEGGPSMYVELTREKDAEDRKVLEEPAEVDTAPAVPAPMPVIDRSDAERMNESANPLVEDYLSLRRLFEQQHPELLSTLDGMQAEVLAQMAKIKSEMPPKPRPSEPEPEVEFDDEQSDDEQSEQSDDEQFDDEQSFNTEDTTIAGPAGNYTIQLQPELWEALFDAAAATYDGGDPAREAFVDAMGTTALSELRLNPLAFQGFVEAIHSSVLKSVLVEMSDNAENEVEYARDAGEDNGDQSLADARQHFHDVHAAIDQRKALMQRYPEASGLLPEPPEPDTGRTINMAQRDHDRFNQVQAALVAEHGWEKTGTGESTAYVMIGGGTTGGALNPDGLRRLYVERRGPWLQVLHADRVVAQVANDETKTPQILAGQLHAAVMALPGAPKPGAPKPGAPKLPSAEGTKLTKHQVDLLGTIVTNQFQDGHHPVDNMIWTQEVTGAFGAGAGGVIAKAMEAGLVDATVEKDRVNGRVVDSGVIAITQKGWDALLEHYGLPSDAGVADIRVAAQKSTDKKPPRAKKSDEPKLSDAALAALAAVGAAAPFRVMIPGPRGGLVRNKAPGFTLKSMPKLVSLGLVEELEKDAVYCITVQGRQVLGASTSATTPAPKISPPGADVVAPGGVAPNGAPGGVAPNGAIIGTFTPGSSDCYLQLRMNRATTGMRLGSHPQTLPTGAPIVCQQDGNFIVSYSSTDGLVQSGVFAPSDREQLQLQLQRLTDKYLMRIPSELQDHPRLVMMYTMTAGQPFTWRARARVVSGVNEFSIDPMREAPGIEHAIAAGWLTAGANNLLTWTL